MMTLADIKARINLTHPYTLVKEFELSSESDSTQHTIAIGTEDLLIVDTIFTGRDSAELVLDALANAQEMFTVEIIGEKTHHQSSTNPDIFMYNYKSLGQGFRWFVLPKNTDYTVKVDAHDLSGAAVLTYPVKIRLHWTGYRLIG